MKITKSIQFQLTVVVGIILLASNFTLVSLLTYNTNQALDKLVIPIHNILTIEIYSLSNFRDELKIFALSLAVISTVIGVFLIYALLGRFLSPLKKLSRHMQHVDRRNLREYIDWHSGSDEINSLICSFNQMIDKLKTSFEMQKDVSAYIAHQLKTPLAVLQAKTEVFQKTERSDEDFRLLLPQLQAQVAKMNHLVNKITELAQIQRISLNESVPLRPLFEELLEDLEEQAKASAITLSLQNFDTPTLNKLSVIGSHTLLYQAFYNILDNSLKYGTRGSQTDIHLCLKSEELSLRIADMGCGIPPEDADFIFEPFFRARNKDTARSEGIGMGLAFSKKVFAHHGASITFSPNTPQGSVFTVCFPSKMIRKEAPDETAFD